MAGTDSVVAGSSVQRARARVAHVFTDYAVLWEGAGVALLEPDATVRVEAGNYRNLTVGVPTIFAMRYGSIRALTERAIAPSVTIGMCIGGTVTVTLSDDRANGIAAASYGDIQIAEVMSGAGVLLAGTIPALRVSGHGTGPGGHLIRHPRRASVPGSLHALLGCLRPVPAAALGLPSPRLQTPLRAHSRSARGPLRGPTHYQPATSRTGGLDETVDRILAHGAPAKE